jgi:hypothetical protein
MVGRWWWVLASAAVTVSQPGPAQRPRPALTITVPVRDSLTRAGPVVRASHVVNDPGVRELLSHGFPVRLHYRVELWSTAGWFDDQLAVDEWDIVARFDPLREMYEAVRLYRDSVTQLGTFKSFTEAVAEIERPARAALVARSGGEQYYNAVLTRSMLSVTDLDELQRWLSGDLSPAVRGRRNPGTALGRGLRTLFTRLLGGETRTLEAQSERFRP